jgi:hypothetical protein
VSATGQSIRPAVFTVERRSRARLPPGRRPDLGPDTAATPASRPASSLTWPAYYRTAVEAIRRQDPHHLVLGDRYGTQAGVPDTVLDAMAPHVDVLSVQTLPGARPLPHRHRLRADRPLATADRLPVLIADTGNWCGWVENPHRGFGLNDPWEEPYGDLLSAVAETNRRLTTSARVPQAPR